MTRLRAPGFFFASVFWQIFLLPHLHLVTGSRQFAIPSFDLVDGNRMPITGIGMCCRESAKGDAARQTVVDYLNFGGRHIDTAVLYQNHVEIGQGIREWIGNNTGSRSAGDLRREIFLTTKVWSDKFGFERSYRSVKNALSELGVDYVDLVLLHVSGEQGGPDAGPDCVEESAEYPGAGNWSLCRRASWAALETLKDEGAVRSIGVSNWDIPKMEALHAVSKYRIAVNQVELHPWYPQRELLAWSKKNKVVVTAYGSMGSQRLAKQILSQDAFTSLSQPRNLQVGQILLRWAVQKGVVVIPGTANPVHMEQNLDLFGFELGEEEMAVLDGIADTNEPIHIYGHRPDLIL
ncbi:unnamed protein product [Amoebophrya sp. A25]|nr:unnamed protein product [Amoebophrya sp. A25]|eukprot:GSA25T00021965001.1